MNFTRQTLLLLAATFALSLFPRQNARGAAGDLYQVYSTSGSVYTYTAGNGSAHPFVSGLAATPNHLAFNRAGDLFVDEGSGNTARILKISPTGTKTTFATGIEANGMTCDDAGNLFVSDALTQSIIKITPAGARSTYASGLNVFDLLFDPNGVLRALDFGGGVNGQARIYRIAPDGSKSFSKGYDRQKYFAADRAGNQYIGTTDGVIYQSSHSYDAASGDDIGTAGTFVAGLGPIKGMACNPAGDVFVSNPSGITRIDKQTKAKTTESVVVGDGLAFEPPRAPALNIATRLQIQTGDNALIAGFIITGSVPKKVLIRGIGPSLGGFGIAGALQDPNLELRSSSGAFVNGNNNWRDTQQAAIEATGAAPNDNRESALLITLGPGSWTAVLRGVGNTTGVGVVEVYDLDAAASSKLGNISSRGVVQAGENVMIGGFIIGGGNGAARLGIRALGPSLGSVGISNPLPDPTLTLRDGNGALVMFNDNWGTAQSTEIYDAYLAPSHPAESAMIVTVPPGNYTAVVAGKDGGTGVGLVEVYNIQ